MAGQAKELSQLRTTVAEQQDALARLHASRDEARQIIDTCRFIINDMYSVICRMIFLDFCETPEPGFITHVANVQNRVGEVLHEIEEWRQRGLAREDVDENMPETAGSDVEW